MLAKSAELIARVRTCKTRIRHTSVGSEMPPIAIILVFSWRANVAELADALDLGSSARKSMGVRPSPFAPKDLDLSELGPCLSIVTVFVTVPPGTRPSSDLRPSGLGYSQCRTADKQIRFGARRFHVLPSAAVPRAPCFERQTYADRESESRRRRDSHANLHPVVMDFSPTSVDPNTPSGSSEHQ
jgi:hypothetical protein